MLNFHWLLCINKIVLHRSWGSQVFTPSKSRKYLLIISKSTPYLDSLPSYSEHHPQLEKSAVTGTNDDHNFSHGHSPCDQFSLTVAVDSNLACEQGQRASGACSQDMWNPGWTVTFSKISCKRPPPYATAATLVNHRLIFPFVLVRDL